VRPDGWCYWHSPSTAQDRAEARRRGGQNRSNRVRAKKGLPDGALTLDQLRGVLGLTIQDVREGRVEPGVGSSVASLARAYVAVNEAGAVEALERDVAELRELIARRGTA
jgi:hypothetical protein